MEIQKIWDQVIENIGDDVIELPTTPKNTRPPVWFSVSTDGNTIYVDVAKKNQPSSKITVQKKLVYQTFERIYPLYLKREEGESVSNKVKFITIDQVYYYSVIKHLGIL